MIVFIALLYNPGSLQMPDQISSNGTQKTNSFTRTLSYNIIIKTDTGINGTEKRAQK